MAARLLLLLALLVSSTLGQFQHLKIPYQPHPTDCSKYVVRDWNRVVIFDCQTGLHWNDAKKTCDDPRESGCTAKLGAITVSLEYYMICPGVSVVYIVLTDKSKFYMCAAHQLLELSCDPDCYFNIHTGRCECSSLHGLPTAPTTPKYIRTSASQPGDCPPIIDPKHPVFFPHSNCEMVYACRSKGMVEARCNDGFHWNAIRNRCEPPWDAGCVDRGAPENTTSAAVATTSERKGVIVTSTSTEDLT